nr:phage/plasmid primase, P4 family [Candidatus Njordarchaeota archaeon]
MLTSNSDETKKPETPLEEAVKPKYGPDGWLPPNYFFEAQDVRNKFLPRKFADFLLDNLRFVHFEDNDDLYIHHDKLGIYLEYGADAIAQQALYQLKDEFNIHRLKEIVACVKAATHKNVIHTNHEEAMKLPSNLIPFLNGALDRTTMQLREDNGDHFFLNRLNVKYDLKATCSNWLKFLSSSVPDETDRKTLQQYLGVCLTTERKYRKALFLVGPTHAGKSTVCDVIKVIFGPYCTNIPLQQLMTKEWERARLFGKLLNVFPEIPQDSIEGDYWFLALTAGDNVSGALKYRNSFDFPALAKHIYTANKLPKTQNHGDEFYIRILLVSFPNQFEPGTTGYDPDLFNKLTTPEELSGIVNWMLEGLQEAERNKGIIQRLSLEETRDAWEVISDAVSKFCQTQIEDSPDSTELKDNIYAAYRTWCRANNESYEEVRHFFEAFIDHYPRERYPETRLPGDKRKRAIKGIKLKEIKPDVQEKLSNVQDAQSVQSAPVPLVLSRKQEDTIEKEVKGIGLDGLDTSQQKERVKTELLATAKTLQLNVPHIRCGGLVQAEVSQEDCLVTGYCQLCHRNVVLAKGMPEFHPETDGWFISNVKENGDGGDHAT